MAKKIEKMKKTQNSYRRLAHLKQPCVTKQNNFPFLAKTKEGHYEIAISTGRNTWVAFPTFRTPSFQEHEFEKYQVRTAGNASQQPNQLERLLPRTKYVGCMRIVKINPDTVRE